MTESHDTEADPRAVLEACDLALLLRELWRRGFVIVPWEADIEFVPEQDGEAMTA